MLAYVLLLVCIFSQVMTGVFQPDHMYEFCPIIPGHWCMQKSIAQCQSQESEYCDQIFCIVEWLQTHQSHYASLFFGLNSFDQFHHFEYRVPPFWVQGSTILSTGCKVLLVACNIMHWQSSCSVLYYCLLQLVCTSLSLWWSEMVNINSCTNEIPVYSIVSFHIQRDLYIRGKKHAR